MTDQEIHEEALAVWQTKNTWGLSRDDFIRLSYFHGCIEQGSDGSGPINGSNDKPDDVIYVSPSGCVLTRSMVGHWFVNSNAFIHGYSVGRTAHITEINT